MNPRLPEAVEDARLLLAYSAKNGITLDRELIDTVVAVGNKADAGAVAEQDEAAFWSALEMLAAKISPVCVSSLQATTDVRAIGEPGFPARLFRSRFSKWSAARRAVRWYTGLAVFALALLLIVQIYWLAGVSITGNIEDTSAKYDRISAQIAESLRQEEHAGPVDLKKMSDDRFKLNDQLSDLQAENLSNYGLLERWSAPWEGRCGQETGSCICSSRDSDIYQACIGTTRENAARMVLSILQRYFLPLLYGLLGASVYCLRTLSSQIQARTYSEASNIDLRIRLYLGTLGGMVSAWFINPEASEGLVKTLSPLAIAFVAGYSVELLFAVMDRIISTFTKKE